LGYVKDSCNCWFLKYLGKPIEDEAGRFKGLPCYIVGKGPSLDYLTELCFANKKAPVISVNEATWKVNEVVPSDRHYSIQAEAVLKDTCFSPNKIVTADCASWYPTAQRLVHDFRYRGRVLTVMQAISCAQVWGCSKVVFVSCDVLADHVIGYPTCVNKEFVWKAADRYRAQWTSIAPLLQRTAYGFITPRSQYG